MSERAPEHSSSPVAIAEGILQGSGRAITLRIFERADRAVGRFGRWDERWPAELVVEATQKEPALVFTGTLQGLGERRALAFSVRNIGMEAPGRELWADVFRGKWFDADETIEGVFLPLNAATRVAALYAARKRTDDPSMRDKIDDEIRGVSGRFSAPARLLPTLGVAHFRFTQTNIQEPRPSANDRRGPKM